MITEPLQAHAEAAAPRALAGVRRAPAGDEPRARGMEALQRRANGGPGVAALHGYRALLGGVAQRTKKGKGSARDKLSSGSVQIPLGQERTLYLASADQAAEHDERDTLRVNMVAGTGETLRDALPDPNKAGDLFHVVAAHAARVGQTEGDVCINCKSGKTRTPVVAIAHLIMRGMGVREAIQRVADAYKLQRPGVGIDYDRKLTGRRLLNDVGAVDADVADDSLLAMIAKTYGPGEGSPPQTVEEWRALETRARGASGKRKSTHRERSLWSAFDRAKNAEDARLEQRRREAAPQAIDPPLAPMLDAPVLPELVPPPPEVDPLASMVMPQPPPAIAQAPLMPLMPLMPPMVVPQPPAPRHTGKRSRDRQVDTPRAKRPRLTEVERLERDFEGSNYWFPKRE